MLTGAATTRRVMIPHEEHEWMEIRMLSWMELDEARAVRERHQLASFKDYAELMGGDTVKAAREAVRQVNGQPAPDTEAAAPARKPEDIYDKASILTAGIVNWSYDEPVSPDTIRRLDAHTAEWALGVLLGMHFMAGTEAGIAARKNGSTLSIST